MRDLSDRSEKEDGGGQGSEEELSAGEEEVADACSLEVEAALSLLEDPGVDVYEEGSDALLAVVGNALQNEPKSAKCSLLFANYHRRNVQPTDDASPR